MDSPFEASKILADVQNWVDSFVAGMNLCPFAKPELTRNRVRFVVSAANSFSVNWSSKDVISCGLSASRNVDVRRKSRSAESFMNFST